MSRPYAGLPEALRQALTLEASCISDCSTKGHGGVCGTKPMDNLKMIGKYAIAAAEGCSMFSKETRLIGLSPSSVGRGDKVIILDLEI